MIPLYKDYRVFTGTIGSYRGFNIRVHIYASTMSKLPDSYSASIEARDNGRIVPSFVAKGLTIYSLREVKDFIDRHYVHKEVAGCIVEKFEDDIKGWKEPN